MIDMRYTYTGHCGPLSRRQAGALAVMMMAQDLKVTVTNTAIVPSHSAK